MIFLTCFIPKQDEQDVTERATIKPSNAVNLFQWNLLDGFSANNVEDLSIINSLPVGIWPSEYKDFHLKGKKRIEKKYSYIEIGTFNLPVIKQISRYISTLRLLKENKDKEVLIYSTYLPYLAAATHRRLRKNTTLIITDLPEYYDLSEDQAFIYRFARKVVARLSKYYMRKINKFVLLTEAMHKAIDVGERPYIVMEGITSNMTKHLVQKQPVLRTSDKSKQIIMYSGSLTLRFGILELLNAINSLERDDLEFWICGKGEGENIVKQVAEKDNRVKYLGFLSLPEVSKLQRQATLLVNPRSPEGRYTKYSFPSKTMEYIQSGRPVVMYKLDGIPEEYAELVYFVEPNETLAQCLERVLDIPGETRLSRSLAAREYILQNKNASVQTQRILKLIGVEKC